MRKARFSGASGNLAQGTLRLRGDLGAAFAAADPTSAAVRLQIADTHGMVVCATLGPWVWKGRQCRFKGAAHGLTKAALRVGRRGVRFAVRGEGVDLRELSGPELHATLSVGERYARGAAPLRRKGKKLIAP